MFKNVMVYRIVSAVEVRSEHLDAAMQKQRQQRCRGTEEKSVGWVEPRGQEHGAMLEVVDGQWIARFMIETKVIPTAVVRRRVEEEVARIESATGRKPGRKEIRDLRDDARLSLLPQAFTKEAYVWVWVDPEEGLLVIDASTQGKADEVITALIKVWDGLNLKLLNTKLSPSAAMALWLKEGEPPANFSIDRDCELKAADESRSVVRYSRHPLDTDEVSAHIRQGKMPTRLALTWDDRVSFVLTEAMHIKRIRFLDVVFEQSGTSASDTQDDGFDVDAAIATAELQKLLGSLVEALDGEMPTQ